MLEYDRRWFLKTCAIAGVGLPADWSVRKAEAAAPAVLSIARSRGEPKDAAAVANQARQLTRRAIDGLGGMKRFVSRGDVVWVKPNIGWDKRPEQAANTNPDVIATLVEICLEAGAKRVIVSDNATNAAQRTFARSGIQEAARKAGAESFFLDSRKFRKMPIKGKVLKEWEVYTDAVEADKLINVPIVKHHNLCRATLGMKNLMGVIGGARNRLHQDLDNALPDLAAFFKPTLVVMDGVRVLMDHGPVGGNLADVKHLGAVAAGTDQVAIDALGATWLGAKPGDVGHLVEAQARGLGKMDFESLAPKRADI
ncbi:MAG: DUF362 domain-containing protein [Vicinamibacteria bacterium]|nr:DUF362 domain-containing protein [Vicinamibacteria bacterium]